MNQFIGVVGVDPEQALGEVLALLQENAKWKSCRFIPTLRTAYTAGCTVMVDKNSPCVSIFPAGEINNSDICSDSNHSVMIASRKSVSAFIHANAELVIDEVKNRQSVYTQHDLRPDAAPHYSETDINAFSTQLKQQLDRPLNKTKTFLQTLNSDFRMIAPCNNGQSTVLAVSPFNPQTLFYCSLRNNEYVVSSNIELLLAISPPKVDPVSLALWLSGRPDPHQSMYANIHQVKPGNYLIFNVNGSIDNERFWDINPQFLMKNVDETELTSTLHKLIATSVASHISAVPIRESVFTQMSGGMDSTSVTALAHVAMSDASMRNEHQNGEQLPLNSSPKSDETQMLGPQHRLHTVSHTYINTESCDETPNIQAMIALFKCANNHFIELDKYTQMSFSELYPIHPQSPGMVLSPKYYEEAKLLKNNNAKLLLTGNGGDEMFWGHSLTYYDRVKKADTKVISEVIQGARALKLPVWPTIRSVFVRPFIKYDLMPFLHLAERYAELRNSSHVPPWLTPKAKNMVDAHNQTAFNAFSGKGSELGKYARYEGIFNTSTFNSMRSYQAVFDEFNLQVEHPLFTSTIAEFSFAVAQKHHISGKYPKLLLRKAMTDLLPKQVCWDDHKIVFDQHFAKLVQQNAVSIRVLLSHTGLEELGLLDNSALLDVFDALVKSTSASLNVDLLYAILVQSWYQTHVVKR